MKMKTLEMVGSTLLAGEIAFNLGSYVLALKWLAFYALLLILLLVFAYRVLKWEQ